MLLVETLERAGAVLFRTRTWLPLVLMPIIAVEARYSYLLGSVMLDQVYQLFCLLVAFAGQAVRILTIGYIPKGTSGRNTTSQKASVLNTTGMYSLLRNPLYLGNMINLLAFSMLFEDWLILLVNFLIYTGIYIPIIMAEEKFLLESFGQEYRDYAERTPCLLPRLGLWIKPQRSWSWRMVLRREHDTFMGIVVVWVVVNQLRSIMINEKFILEPVYVGILAAVLLVWAVLKSLKKFTKVLKTPAPAVEPARQSRQDEKMPVG